MRRIVITLIGCALFPASWACLQVCYELLVDLQTEADTQRDLMWFTGGATGWVLFFLCMGRPVRLYILGHELTHLAAAWASGVRGGNLTLSHSGGSVTVERTTFWISVAPYLIPLYSLIVLITAGILRIWYPQVASSFWFPLVMGITWSFHLTFTIYALSRPQHDLKPYGFLGSVSIIILVNLLLLTLTAAIAHPSPLKEDVQRFASTQQQVYRELVNTVWPEKLQ